VRRLSLDLNQDSNDQNVDNRDDGVTRAVVLGQARSRQLSEGKVSHALLRAKTMPACQPDSGPRSCQSRRGPGHRKSAPVAFVDGLCWAICSTTVIGPSDGELARWIGYGLGRRATKVLPPEPGSSRRRSTTHHARLRRQESRPELVHQALHHGRFVAFRHIDEAKTLHRIGSPEAANRDQQIQILSNRIRHDCL